MRGDLPGEDFSQSAEDSFGLTGADIARLVRLARRVARRDRRAVTVADIMRTLPGRVPLSEKFRWAPAVHELGHAVVAVATGKARIFFGWRPYARKWAFPNPVWSELRTAFQEGRDDVPDGSKRCPVFS